MKIRAKTNGDVIDVPEDAANILIEAGIYEATDGETLRTTAVGPLTTDGMPPRTKRAK